MSLRLEADKTVEAARRQLAAAFRRRAIDSPELDARILVGHALGLDHTGLVRAADRMLTAAERARIAELGARRIAGEPVARILGYKEFWGLPLRVTGAVLVPRPETETVVEAALAACEGTGPRDRPRRILDLGTGSGALLLALLHELPTSTGVGTDRAAAALLVARGNAEDLGLGRRAHWVGCDYAEALSDRFDLIVSNPPYVKRSDIADLAPEVRDFDPHGALDGGPDGLDAYRAIAAGVTRVLAPGGHLVVELGAGQASAVAHLLAASGLAVETAGCDLSGTERALTARLAP
ncbi:MAG TPA: peptide chain release factor N(5)-glutamine methyltransferase [Xanthobacteraceae bacterium]|nr:peptide chain release factor N(5)-glutamine methyltransferase [Xanthobacteraceae bacterium]